VISGPRLRFLASAAVAVATFAAPSAASAESPPVENRFSLANGCFALASNAAEAPPALQRLRLEPTTLGSYMLYDRDGRYLSADGDAVSPEPTPGPAADWVVEDNGSSSGVFTFSPRSTPGSQLSIDGDGAGVANGGAGPASQITPVRVSGCKRFPEAEINVDGAPREGRVPYGEVRGLFDGHMHWMNFEYLGGNFHCGRPWSRYGITRALPDCEEIEGPQGLGAPLQNTLNFGNPAAAHDTRGYPQMTEWRRDNLTYEGTYYRWLERAWRSGLRLIVMPTNDNRVLCELLPDRRNPCDEMVVTIQELKNMYDLQDYVDAQAGGPGEGWFEIVKNPFQARKVMNEGRMAVVLEVETSEIFNCIGTNRTNCNRETITAGLERLHRLGVRSSLLLNKFDTPLAGVRFDGGEIGVLINAGNRSSYGAFWDAETCKGEEADNEIFTTAEPAAAVVALLEAMGVDSGTLPTYPPAHHCNEIGLTSLGKHMVREMMRLKMIVNPDHMSQAAVDQTISLAEASDYSGVISPHGWIDPRNWPRIFQLGGMAFPSSGSPEGYVDTWKTYRPKSTPYMLGWGYGADLGGLAAQPPGTPPGEPNSVTYPFESFDGAATVERQVTGERTFDFAEEGVAHYGLYPEWAREVQLRGTDKLHSDMMHGPEAYLQMWERATGIRAAKCGRAGAPITRAGIGKLRLGMPANKLLKRAGQPLKRFRAWTYCVRGSRGKGAGQAAVLTPGGKVAMVASTAPYQRALGVAPGAPQRKLRRVGARKQGKGLWVKRSQGRTFAWEVRKGRVTKAAVANRAGARNAKTLRKNLRLVPKGTKKRPPKLETKPSNRLGPAEAVPLSVQQGAAQFPLYCALTL
jgi:hypothetical protein